MTKITSFFRDLERYFPRRVRRSLQVRLLKHQSEKMREQYRQRIAEVEKSGDRDKVDELASEASFFLAEVVDPVWAIESEKLLERASKHGVYLWDVGYDEKSRERHSEENRKSPWEIGQWGDHWLTKTADQEIRKRLRQVSVNTRRSAAKRGNFGLILFLASSDY